MFSCEICKISKNTFFTEHLWWLLLNSQQLEFLVEKKNLFKRLKYPSLNALNIKYFWTLSYNYWSFLGITKLSKSLTSKKRYAQKTSGCGTVMQHNKQPIQNECRTSLSEKAFLFEIFLPDDGGSISET